MGVYKMLVLSLMDNLPTEAKQNLEVPDVCGYLSNILPIDPTIIILIAFAVIFFIACKWGQGGGKKK